MRAVITVIGHDKIGIIAKVSAILSESSVNILDISQTIMQDMFTMIMLVDISKSTIPFSELKDQFMNAGENMGLRILVMHEDIFNSMHKI